MTSTITILSGLRASTAPTAGSLVNGELAINITDGVLYYKDNAGAVQKIGTKGGVGTSSTTQVLYNSSGLIAGSANMTFSGTALTLANDASISGLTVGKGSGAISSNTTVGSGALASGSSSGGFNAAFGTNAMAVNTSGGNNSAFGYGAMAANTTGGLNAAVGVNALTANTTGGSNTAFGVQSLTANTTASYNTAVGYQALYTNSTGSYNTALGISAGYSQSTGLYNTYVGRDSGYSATGSSSCFVGHTSGYYTTGSSNTLIGSQSGYLITSGAKNTVLGSFSGNQGGLDIRTSSNYIVLSDGDGNPRLVGDNNGNIYAGQGALGSINTSGGWYFAPNSGTAYHLTAHVSGSANGSPYHYFYYNNTNIGSITQTGTTAVLYNTTSDYRLKTDVKPIADGLSTIQALNPVNFIWIDGRKDDGFIAHEIQAVIPNCVTGEKDAVNEDGTPKYQQMDNSGVIPFLVKAVQELKAEIDQLKGNK